MKKQIDFDNFLGMKKSDRGSYVTELQKFLKRFGYLRSKQKNILKNNNSYVTPSNCKETIFDSPTQNALKLYQQLHGLKQTGILGNDTLNYMKTPRCGN